MNPKWDKYHSTADANTLLEGWAKAFPDLTKLYSIGETLKGTQLMVLEISNKKPVYLQPNLPIIMMVIFMQES